MIFQGEIESQTCWEYNNCLDEIKENCEIYKNDTGRECAFLYCPLKPCKIDRFCMKCPWFSKTSFMDNIGKPEILNKI